MKMQTKLMKSNTEHSRTSQTLMASYSLDSYDYLAASFMLTDFAILKLFRRIVIRTLIPVVTAADDLGVYS